jgi:hypothetical protein
MMLCSRFTVVGLTGAVNKIAADGSRRYVMFDNDSDPSNPPTGSTLEDTEDSGNDEGNGGDTICVEASRFSRSGVISQDILSLAEVACSNETTRSERMRAHVILDDEEEEEEEEGGEGGGGGGGASGDEVVESGSDGGGGFCVESDHEDTEETVCSPAKGVLLATDTTTQHESSSSSSSSSSSLSSSVLEWECVSCSFYNPFAAEVCDFCGARCPDKLDDTEGNRPARAPSPSPSTVQKPQCSVEEEESVKEKTAICLAPVALAEESGEEVTDLNYLHAGYEEDDDDEDVEWESASEQEEEKEQGGGGQVVLPLRNEESFVDFSAGGLCKSSSSDDGGNNAASGSESNATRLGVVNQRSSKSSSSSPINSNSSPINSSSSPININSSSNSGGGNGSSGIDTDLLRRAVTSAAGMGDWAGRAVQRVLEGHIAQCSSGSSSVSTPTRMSSSPSSSSAAAAVPASVSAQRGLRDVGRDFERSKSKSMTLEEEKEDENGGGGGGTRHSQVHHLDTVDHAKSDVLRSDRTATGRSSSSAIISDSPQERDPYSDSPSRLFDSRNILENNEDDFGGRRDNIAVQKALRDTQGLTSEMVEEVKQLLDTFHLPWVTAPFEAEAQCAYLEQIGLVQGG